MGTWGPGNFDSDQAGDYLHHSILDPLFIVVRDFFERQIVEESQLSEDEFYGSVADRNFDFAEEKIVPTIDVLTTLCEHYRTRLDLRPETAEKWQKLYIQLYDQVINDWGAKPDYIIERRQVIMATFDQLIALARDWDERTSTSESMRIKVTSVKETVPLGTVITFDSDFGKAQGIWERGTVQAEKTYFVELYIGEKLEWGVDIMRSADDRVAMEFRDDHVYLWAKVRVVGTDYIGVTIAIPSPIMLRFGS